MDNEKKQSNEQNRGESWWGTACCGPQDESGGSWNCCGGGGGARDCRSMMDRCMKGCRWLPLVPVAMGVLFLLVGYYVDAEVGRVLWMILAGLTILMGAFGFLMMRLMRRACAG